MAASFANPFRPGAGHTPPYLAGRDEERREFERLLRQTVILENLVLTGLRGVGKTVLLDSLKPTAQKAGWLWVAADLSESASISEEAIALRIVTDLSAVTSSLQIGTTERQRLGFAAPKESLPVTLRFEILKGIYDGTPGLVADKLKKVLETTWAALRRSEGDAPGLVFAYDEAQNLADHAAREQYPPSLLLDVFQSIQKKGVRFMLVLSGLPTLFPKLVEARTFSERMFRVLFLRRLATDDSRDAILKPIDKAACPVRLDTNSVNLVIAESSGYPYFIQFICREVYDAFLAEMQQTGKAGGVPMDAITKKLDTDFFAGRWARVTDRQRDLLYVIARLPNCDEEFTVQEIVEESQGGTTKPFGASHVNQILVALAKAGLVYKNRHGRYSFAVPLFGQFVLRVKGTA